MESWLSHFLAVLGGGGVVGVLTTFILKWRKQSADNRQQEAVGSREDWQALFTQARSDRDGLAQRITALEARDVDRQKEAEALRKEHVECLMSHSQMKGELEAQKGISLRMHEENQQKLAVILEALRGKNS